MWTGEVLKNIPMKSSQHELKQNPEKQNITGLSTIE